MGSFPVTVGDRRGFRSSSKQGDHEVFQPSTSHSSGVNPLPPDTSSMFGTSKILSIVKASGCDIKTPGHVPLDVENYPVAPDNLALEQVHVYVRHGRC